MIKYCIVSCINQTTLYIIHSEVRVMNRLQSSRGDREWTLIKRLRVCAQNSTWYNISTSGAAQLVKQHTSQRVNWETSSSKNRKLIIHTFWAIAALTDTFVVFLKSPCVSIRLRFIQRFSSLIDLKNTCHNDCTHSYTDNATSGAVHICWPDVPMRTFILSMIWSCWSLTFFFKYISF